ncbi:MAG: NAD(P)/FAD-dependent oxidoreductase [Coxiellaceae bacterium]|nr:MAG: NAD(P)/FAD-dependent oxidoreductase [Coxiellaceae bacterium]
MSTRKSKVAVIGAGPMGLMATYELLKQGHDVCLYERDHRIGGMTASFDLGGTKIERFYHFICVTDYPLFDLLKELNLEDKLVWTATKMGFFHRDKLHDWGDPISLLKFPGLSFLAKFRYGLHVLHSKRIKDWSKLDQVEATSWLKRWLGQEAYDVLWDSLFKYKFYDFQTHLSAAWIGARIRRMARSRSSLLKESLGYLKGGSDTLLDALEARIHAMGGKILLNADVQQLQTEEQKVTGILVNDKIETFDHVISTVPLPYIPKLAPQLPTQLKDQISSIANIGVACVVLKLKKPFAKYFWLNINDPRMEIPGVIEYSNLNPEVGHVLYVPYYMPHNHVKYRNTDEQFVSEVIEKLSLINPTFSANDILASKVARYAYAQTVCSPNFYEKLPKMTTPIKGFYMADTAFYYPEDRCIAESVAVGTQLAKLVQHVD